MASIERLKQFFAADRSNAELACDLLEALARQGLHADALSLAGELPEDLQRQAGIVFRVAQLHLAQGRYESAINALSALWEREPSAPVAHDLAFALLCAGRRPEARGRLLEAQARFGESAEYEVLLARLDLFEHDGASAEQHLHRALLLKPDDPTAMGLQALAAFDRGDIERAAVMAEQCLARYPDQHEALLAQGGLALAAGDAGLSQDIFQRALTRFANSGRALSGLGQSLLALGQVGPAGEALAHAVKTMPNHIGTWHALAWWQLIHGRLDEAEASFHSAYALDRNFPESHGGLAIVAAVRGQSEEAEGHIARANRLDARNFSGRYARCLLLHRSGNAEAAQALLDEIFADGRIPAAYGGADQLQSFLRLVQAEAAPAPGRVGTRH
ncbi:MULTISPECIES: tetratricopeptide repeat protein [Pseudoxanthomonas]|uniref:Flp pilus assembly protein TadD n=1 Tax=Pseudoxanthomonas winnipegensis TaxID=2480810 RepID=A0AAW8GGD8_9GAMM|nr:MULTISPECIES: tetratricopeptide repeat protein [Pseudoxanthomonas]MDQ1120683.1 Flp pilus assembly protein TadD [Pseudoxanthomonas winnipegensis]MDQ1133906.1 Flp pilus assembly protein TadD [Pseudoxanthomonas winnipegensis]MDR6139858.1 Flp pilus assembly protein TadD [Pseudoxanthomonas sp. SORGH_AS_0997]